MLQASQVLVHPRIEGHHSARIARDPAVVSADGAYADLQLSVHHDLGTVEQEWRRFEQVADCTVFQSFDWLSTWQKHVGALTQTTPAVVLGRRRSGELLFILPLATRRTGALTQLAFLGRDLGDYNAPLLAPDFADVIGSRFPTLWRDICAALQSDPRHRHDMVLLDKMPERIGGQRNPFLQLEVTLNPSGAYLTSLMPTWDDFYTAKRSSATRRRDRTKRKRLAESGEVQMVTPCDPDAIADTLATLLDQKQRSFARMGVSNIFERPGYRAFFFDLATGPQTRALVHVSRLEVGSFPAATNLGLVFRGGYYHVIASYDDGPLARFGPGAAHLHDLMHHAIERGCTFFDFTIGDEPYKRDWCDAEIRIYDHVATAGVRGWLMASGMNVRSRAKRAVKQSAWLWPAAMRLRAAMASIKRRLPLRDLASGR